jgi:hypothetical protein
MRASTTPNSSAENLEDYTVEHTEMNGHKVEIMKNVNGLIMLHMYEKHLWKEIPFL